MASLNYSTMQMTTKIVYYGPGLCGKTTNLQHIYDHSTPHSRGEMVSLETQADRTLFFDLLPLEVGTIAGFRTRIQLYTVPGQVFYNTTRKLVLKGADGIVFVADSQRSMLDANLESLHNLEANLAEIGILVDTVPIFLQFNKRDLSDIFSVDEMNQILNRRDWPHMEASAINGVGVFETLRGISKMALLSLKKQLEAPRLRQAATAGRLSTATATVPPRRAPADAQTVTAPPADTPSATAFEPPAAGGGGGNGRREVHRSLHLRLPRGELERATAVALDLQIEDADQRIVHRVRDYRLALDERGRGEDVVVRLQIALDGEE